MYKNVKLKINIKRLHTDCAAQSKSQKTSSSLCGEVWLEIVTMSCQKYLVVSHFRTPQSNVAWQPSSLTVIPPSSPLYMKANSCTRNLKVTDMRCGSADVIWVKRTNWTCPWIAEMYSANILFWWLASNYCLLYCFYRVKKKRGSEMKPCNHHVLALWEFALLRCPWAKHSHILPAHSV